MGGLVAALGFAYTETFWSVTTIAEVYALALLLIALALTALFTWYLRLDRATVLGVPRSLAAFMLLWGLALGVHYSALFLAPAASLLLLARRGDWRAWGPRGGAVLIALGAVGPALYLLLPLRAAAAVPLAWGDPRTVERFLAHVSGRQYQGNLFTSDLATIAAQGIRAMRVLANDLTPPLLALAALGAWRLGRGQPRAPFWALLATMAFTLFVAVNYNIEEDWETYLLIALLGLATLAGIGAADVVGRASRPRAALATGIVLAALPLVPLALHFGEQDHSRDHLARNYALNLLAGLEPNAVLLTRDWNVYSPLLYTQHVEQVRPDVTAIDVLLLRRSWYYRYLEEHYPWLLSGARAEVDAYLEQLAEFEAGRPYDPAAIQGRFVAMINAFIAVARRERPVYLTPGWDPGVASGLVLVPAHLAFQVLSPEEEAAGAGLGVALRAPAWDLAGVNDGTAPQDPVARRMLPTYARMELNRGLYLASEERWAESERALRDTLALAPDLAVAQSKLGLTLAVQGRDLEARAAFEAALQLDPANQEARQGWEMVRRRLGG